MEVPSKI